MLSVGGKHRVGDRADDDPEERTQHRVSPFAGHDTMNVAGGIIAHSGPEPKPEAAAAGYVARVATATRCPHTRAP